MKKISLPLFLVLISLSAVSQNPQLLKDVYPGTTGSGIQEIVKTSGFTFFNALDGTSADRGLYRTDGTSPGTIKLDLTYPTYISTKADKLTALGNKVIFAGDNFANYGEIWSSDGTQSGTIAIERYQPTLTGVKPIMDMAALGNEVLYGVVNSSNRSLLKKTDGTVAGTSVVYDFSSLNRAVDLALFKNINNILYFNLYDLNGAGNDQLWRSDGTTAGTYMLKDFGLDQYVASYYMPAGLSFYLMIVTPGTGNVLWKSDGTVSGTAALKTIGTTGNNNYPQNVAIGSTLYFAGLDGNGKELWKTDGTATGTLIISDINPGSASSNPSLFTVLNNNIYFSATTINEGTELWKYDGVNTSLVKDINPGAASGSPGSLVVSNNTIIMRANTATSGYELWITDGTNANTQQLADINPGVANSGPNFLTAGNKVYFSANNGINGSEIFVYDNSAGVSVLHKLFVNDNSTLGDVFASAVGNNANNGVSTAPFATIEYALSIAQAGDTIYVDAGTYATPNLTIDKAITIIGPNQSITPNNTVNKLLANIGRNPEAIVTGSTFTISSNNVQLKGLYFDPGAKSQIVLTNTGFNNFRYTKNFSKITSGTLITLTGPTIPSSQTPLFGNHTIEDNRFEKIGIAYSTGVSVGFLNNVTINNNAFVTPAPATSNVLLNCYAGFGGAASNFSYSNNVSDGSNYDVFSFNLVSGVIANNTSLQSRRSFFIQTLNSGSADIKIKNNFIETNFALTSPIYSFNFGGATPGSTCNVLIEDNTVIQNAAGRNTVPNALSIFMPGASPNTSASLKRNKLTFTGDFNLLTTSNVTGMSLSGKLQSLLVEDNEISFNGTNLTATVPVNSPASSGIFLSSDGGTANAIPSNAVMNFTGNKITGFRNSIAIYDASAAVPNTYIGYGNLPLGVTATFQNNSFTGDEFCVNNGTIGQPVIATCNWFGSADAVAVVPKLTTNVIYSPWLSNGTDNDAAIGFQPVPGTCNGRQNKFYVNDNSQSGDVYTTAIGNNSNNGFSTSPYATIQYAINQAQAGDTIYVDAGLFAERIFVNKPLTLKGAYFGNNPGNALTRGSSETVLIPATENNLSEIITVQAADINIDGFVFDGDNPSITGSITLNGVDVNSGMGIYNGQLQTDRLVVKNNIFKNFYRYAMLIEKNTGSPISGLIFSQNKIDNISSRTGREGRGVALFSNIYGSITNNNLTRVYNGLLIVNYYTGSTELLNINNNIIEAYNYGIYSPNNVGLTSAYNLNNNTISAADFATWNSPGSSTVNNSTGMYIGTSTNTTLSTVNNIISGMRTGLYIEGSTVPLGMNINGGSISNCTQIGVFYIARNADNAKLKISDVSLSNNDVGIDASYVGGSPLQLEFMNTNITGGSVGLRLYGNQVAFPGNVLDGVSFSSQSAQHILLTVDALTGKSIDARSVKFNGLTGAEMSLPQLLATEDKIVHKVDNEPFGFIRIKERQVFLTENSFYNLPAFGSTTTTPELVRAINSASTADTINVGAGLYNTNDLSLNKSLTFLGPNALVTPNEATNKSLPNAARATEAIISGATLNIGVSNLSFQGFTFDPGNKSAFVLSNTAATDNNFGDFDFTKNILKISNTNNGISQIAVTGKFVTTPSLPITGGYSITDNRFEKSGTATGNSINFSYLKNVSVANNSFVVTGTPSRSQQAINLGSTGLVDNISFSNNYISDASTAVGGGRIAGAVISGNKMRNLGNAFANTNSMPESSSIEFSNNDVSNDLGTPFMLYNRFNGSLPGTTNLLKVENNVFAGVSLAGVNQLFGTMNFTINNSVQQPTIQIKGNKINSTGDFSAINSQYLRPITVRGNIVNLTIENNEILLNNSGALGAFDINLPLPVNPAITIGTDNGTGAYMTAAALININNNKISGYKQSVVMYDVANNGHDTYTGYGNIPAGAVVNINNNSFAADSISINNGTNSRVINGNCNWYGAADAANAFAKVSATTVNYLPWLTNGTDNNIATGFQPVPGSCNGTPPVITLDNTVNVSCFAANNGKINITVTGGSAPYLFNWSLNGTAGYSNLEDLTDLPPGTYAVSLTDANGSVDTLRNIVITEPTLLIVTIADNSTICANNALATANDGTAPYTYLWNTGQTVASLVNVPAGTYIITVTDAKGCTKTSTIILTVKDGVKPRATVTNVSCFGGNNGVFTVTSASGIAPFSYSLNNGASYQASNIFNNLVAGTYTVLVKDANNCVGFVTQTIAEPAVLSITFISNQPICFGGNGSISINVTGGTGGKSYSWTGPAGYTSTSQNLSQLSVAGNYNVTVTDANGCTKQLTATLVVRAEILVNAVVTNIACKGAGNGSITLTVSGGSGSGYLYSWIGPLGFISASQNLSNLAVGNYNLTVTDDAGCSTVKSYRITEPSGITKISTTRNNVGGCNNLGSIIATATGGTSPYLFKLDNGNYQSSGTFTGLYAGTYVITLKDQNNCTDVATVIITDNGSDSYEKNDTKSKAAAITMNTLINARIAVISDPADWFQFTTPAGSGNYIVSFTHPSASFTYNLYAAGNNTPPLTPVTTGTSSKEYVLAGNTTYYISVTGGLSYVCYDLMVYSSVPFAKATIPPAEKKVVAKKDVAINIVPDAKLSATVYPNPHHGTFTMNIVSPEKGTAVIELFTVNGQKLQQKTVLLQASGTLAVPFTITQHGTMFYKVQVGKNIVTGKIIGLD